LSSFFSSSSFTPAVREGGQRTDGGRGGVGGGEEREVFAFSISRFCVI